MAYRVVYGETMPVWEKVFLTKREAVDFAQEHESFGDIIFSITKCRAGDPPKSMAGLIAAGAFTGLVKS